MDTTEQYILKAEKAVLIQRKHLLTYGDWYALKSSGQVKVAGAGFWPHFYTWLPRIDQLQTMFESSCTLNLIGIFYDWLSSECFQPEVPATVFKDEYEDVSIEQLWLSMVMLNNYGKQWSDEKEDWLERSAT